MRVGISSVRTKNTKIDRHELASSLQKLNHCVSFIGMDSNDNLHSDYEKYNVKFIAIPLIRTNINPLYEVKTIRDTKKALSHNNIEVLIAYGIRTFPTMVIAARLSKVKKILCVVNGSGRLFVLKGLKGFLVKLIAYPMLCLAFLLTTRILFQNSDDMKMIKGKGLLWRKNYDIVNGSGVNLNEYYTNYIEKKPIFLMVSRLTGSKGVNEFVKAARIVKQSYSEALFNLIGPMDNDDSSIDMLELQKAVDDNIINLKGRVEDVRPYIEQSRVFALPSYYPEGIPRSILEAMAMKRPIITVDSSGCRDTVVDGVNGFLVPPRDANMLAEKMIWMIENQEKAIEMGQKSREICEQKFDVNKINMAMINKIGLK